MNKISCLGCEFSLPVFLLFELVFSSSSPPPSFNELYDEYSESVLCPNCDFPMVFVRGHWLCNDCGLYLKGDLVE